MNAVFLVGVIQSFFFALLIFNKREKTQADYFLALWLILLGIHLLFPFFLYMNYPEFLFFSGWDIGLLVLHAVLLFIYTQLITNNFEKLKKIYLLHFIPVLITYILSWPYIVMPATDKRLLIENKVPIPQFLISSGLFILITIIYYMIRVVRGINFFQKEIKEYQSNIDKINLKWLKQISKTWVWLYSFLTIGGSILIYFKILYLQIDYFIYLLMVGLIFCIGFWGFKQGRIFNYSSVDGSRLRNNSKKAAKITLKEREFAKRLIDHMNVEKPYLDNELSLFILAELLSTKPHNLSFILNNVLKTNFYDLINSYRVKEFIKKIKTSEASRESFLSIALDCGFNSKPSFNRIFKKETGKTPSQFKKSL